MRFEHFINENEIENKELPEKLPAGIISELKDNCAPFIKAMKKVSGLFYRGSKSFDPTDVYKLFNSHLENRKPFSISKRYHDAYNKLFKAKFGWNVRNGVFTYGGRLTGIYHHPGIFLPVGDFKFVWSETIQDLYYEEYTNPRNMVNLVRQYTDKYFGEASVSNHEVSFNCKSYYIVNTKYTKDMLEIFG